MVQAKGFREGRSKEEKEAQHLKTLEKHEKERDNSEEVLGNEHTVVTKLEMEVEVIMNSENLMQDLVS